MVPLSQFPRFFSCCLQEGGGGFLRLCKILSSPRLCKFLKAWSFFWTGKAWQGAGLRLFSSSYSLDIGGSFVKCFVRSSQVKSVVMVFLSSQNRGRARSWPSTSRYCPGLSNEYDTEPQTRICNHVFIFLLRLIFSVMAKFFPLKTCYCLLAPGDNESYIHHLSIFYTDTLPVEKEK